MAYLVVKKLGSPTGGRMFEFTKHVNQLGSIARRGRPWAVWIRGPEKPVDTKYEVVFAATNNNQHDRLNFRKRLNLSKNQKTQNRIDKLIRRLFGIPSSLEFVKAGIAISLDRKRNRIVLTLLSMKWS